MEAEPFVRCCESCARWRRHPATGAGLCMAGPCTPAETTLRRVALAAGNALNRCPEFIALAPARAPASTPHASAADH